MKRGKGRPVLLVVLLLVNAAAVWGQAGWALDHIVPEGWTFGPALALSLGFALAIETIGVFLALSADHAEDRDIPAGGIRLGSYAIGLVSGLLNASHWGWTSAAAIAFALLSTISPFLWGIHSRVNRERTIPPSRRFWHPRQSIKLIRHMAWEGIATEQEGIASMNGQDKPLHAKVVDLAEAIGQPLDPWQRELIVKVFTPGPDGELPQFNPPAGALATTEQLEQAAERTLSLAAAPVSPATPRAPRAPKQAQELAVRMLLDGASVDQAALETGVGASTLRMYDKARRLLLADPSAEIGPKLDGRSINPALLEIIRAWANREGRVL